LSRPPSRKRKRAKWIRSVRPAFSHLMRLACAGLFLVGPCGWAADKVPAPSPGAAPFTRAQRIGRLADERLVECSGMDVSRAAPDLLWAVNDGGNGPYLFALRPDGRRLGRVLVRGAQNRDWEGMDTFLWQGQPMILIADFGDNRQVHDAHTLYVVAEPRLPDEGFDADAAVDVAWRIVFRYPDRPHDAEGAAVDAAAGKVLVLTKRDLPPLLFEVPLAPAGDDRPAVATPSGVVDRIPPPTPDDLPHKFGIFRSQPTALDIAPIGRRAAVLTYKHAYIFTRGESGSWAEAFAAPPLLIPLPLPQDTADLHQREALCFTPDGSALLMTSEGRGAGIYRVGLQ
jgi:hypothetical protein